MSNDIIGIGYPFIDNRDGLLNPLKDKIQLAKSKLLFLLSVNKGQRIMNPLFGTNIIKFLFQPITQTLFTRIKNHLQQEIKIWIPQIVVQKIQLQRRDQNKIILKISYSVDQKIMQLELQYDLQNMEDI